MFSIKMSMENQELYLKGIYETDPVNTAVWVPDEKEKRLWGRRSSVVKYIKALSVKFSGLSIIEDSEKTHEQLNKEKNHLRHERINDFKNEQKEDKHKILEVHQLCNQCINKCKQNIEATILFCPKFHHQENVL